MTGSTNKTKLLQIPRRTKIRNHFKFKTKGTIISRKNNKSEKSNGGCYVYGKQGHKAWQRYNRKDASINGQKSDQNKNQAHIAEVTDDVIAAVVSEVNLVGNKAEWVVDTGATKHFCSDKDLFSDFTEFMNAEQVYMGNSSSSEVLGFYLWKLYCL